MNEESFDDEDRCTIASPLYLITSTEGCWRCRKPQSVIALASRSVQEAEEEGEPEEHSDPVILSNISKMPREVEDYLVKRFTRYRPHYSRTAESTYFTNFCECGANFGDFYLHCEPCGAFFPTEADEAGRISIEELPFQGNLVFHCQAGYGLGGFIFEHARKVSGNTPKSDSCES